MRVSQAPYQSGTDLFLQKKNPQVTCSTTQSFHTEKAASMVIQQKKTAAKKKEKKSQ